MYLSNNNNKKEDKDLHLTRGLKKAMAHEGDGAFGRVPKGLLWGLEEFDIRWRATII